MSAERANFNWLANITPALALLAPALYVIGFVYHETYLETFGLNAGDFPKATQEYFTFAYYCLLAQALKTFKWIVYAVVGWLLVFIPFVLVVYFWRKAEDRFADRQGARLRGRVDKEIMMSAIETWERLSKFCVAILVLVMTLILSALFAIQSGQEQAVAQQKNHPGCDVVANRTVGCTVLRDNNTVIAAGLLVARSSTHLALYANNKTTTYPLKDYLIDSYPKSKEVNNPP